MMRVRFAPSPTGYLHIGNARTALFNYLLARRHGGRFVLRIEDTDRERSRPEYEQALIEDLRWLGLDWDEGPDVGGPVGPYRQSERLALYRDAAEKLLRENAAYPCYCLKEEIERRRVDAGGDRSEGYDNRCRTLTEAQRRQCEAEGRKPVLRFRVPEQAVEVQDLIRGRVVFESGVIPDFVIVKSDGMPTFHFAVVVDDSLMGITHVVRGEDHLSNTPKHILLFRALGAQVPQFAHMSMTLGPDRTRLSKRHGATSVRAYRQAGYLPEAFFNYIALLGWGSAEGQEMFSREELIREFSLERCNRSSAVFDPQKLLWMNGVYLRQLPSEELVRRAVPFLQSAGLLPDQPAPASLELAARALALEQEKLRTLQDAADRLDFFFREVSYDPEAVAKYLDAAGRQVLAELEPVLAGMEPFDRRGLEESVRAYCRQKGVKTSAVFHPLRVAVSGRTAGPGLFEMLELLGKDTVLRRIRGILRQG